METCTGRAAGGSARCPRRQMKWRTWADRLTPAHRKAFVDPLCLRWPGSACHVGDFALLGRSVPAPTLTTCHNLQRKCGSVERCGPLVGCRTICSAATERTYA
jgi:hypothetical protein